MSDDCWSFCCLCCVCFGIFGQDGCMDCGCCPPKGKEDEESAKAARAKEYDLFIQAQPGPHPPPSSTKPITAEDPDTVVNEVQVEEKPKPKIGDPQDQFPVGTDRITQHEDILRSTAQEIDTSPDVEVQPALAVSVSSLPKITAADPEKLVSLTEEGHSKGAGGADKETFEEEFPNDRVAAHKEKAEEYYYWGGGGSS